MKKFKISMLAIAGMLFTACSDNDLGKGGLQKEQLADGYMSLNINLPTAPSSSMLRAANDDFADGDPDEYNVKDCVVLLFQGKDEKTATLFSVQPVLQFEGIDGTDGDNVTTTYQPVLKIKDYDTENRLFALAVLNYKNVLTIETETNEAFVEDTPIETLADIREVKTSANLTTRNNTKNYFFMTNAVLSNAQGGNVTVVPASTDIFQLAELSNEEIYETEAEAKEHPAGEIFVERAVAKATLKLSETLKSKMFIGDEEKGLAIDEITWTIDNTEPTTYVARNPGDLAYIGYKSEGRDNYRFVGALSTKYLSNPNVDNDYYRTYWCVDPQYDKEAAGMVGATGGVKTPSDGTTALYCHENTFNVEHQTYHNTTRAIIKVKLKKTQNFYTINGGDPDTQENAEGAIKDYIFNKTAVLNAFKNQLDNSTQSQSYEVTLSSFDLEFAADPVTGQYKISKLEANESEVVAPLFKAGAKAAIDEVLSKQKDVINKEIIVRQYTGGEIYYVARFKHFAGENAKDPKDLAPWKSGETWETAPETSDAYHETKEPAKAAQNYLGRYGMVRNNWYEVEITAFNKLGYPADPSGKVDNPFFDEPDTTDDNFEEVISTKIHVLSWAKRTQKWEF